MSWRSEGAEVPDPQDPTILRRQKLVFPSKFHGGDGGKLPETGHTKLVKGLLKKCVLQEKSE